MGWVLGVWVAVAVLLWIVADRPRVHPWRRRHPRLWLVAIYVGLVEDDRIELTEPDM